MLRRTGRTSSSPSLPVPGGIKEHDNPLCDDCETAVDTHITNRFVAIVFKNLKYFEFVIHFIIEKLIVLRQTLNNF